MSAREFRDDDAGYIAWIAAHPDGYVLNIRRGHNAGDARFHLARCDRISGENPRGGPWTGQFVKVCGDDLSDLERWAAEHARGTIKRCGICRPTRDRALGAAEARSPAIPANRRPSAAPRADLRGPDPTRRVVEAWADDYVHFQNRPAWQDELRRQILGRVGQLVPTDEEVLHATFFGPLPPRTDVENLLLYNFSSFGSATHRGMRFELGGEVPSGPDGSQYRYGYRYELAPRTGSYGAWRDGRLLASFDWVDLGMLSGDKICEQVWLALARTEIAVAIPPREPTQTFSVRLTIRPRAGATRGVAGLVKGVFDGVISAFQAHTDGSDLAELTTRAAKHIPVEPAELESLLARRDKAVLGAVQSLLHRRGEGVQWSPADDFCVAGELLAESAVGSGWAIRGQIVEVGSRG